MKQEAVLQIKDDTFNFSDFDKINKTVTLTFAGRRITIQPSLAEETERKFSFCLNEQKESLNKYLVEYLRDECEIKESTFSLIFKYLPSPIGGDIYYYDVVPFEDYSLEELSELYKGQLDEDL